MITAQINGVDMEAGDKIGIFDWGICVGTGVLSGLEIPVALSNSSGY